MSIKKLHNFTCTITAFVEQVSWWEITTTDTILYQDIPCQFYSNNSYKYKQTDTILDSDDSKVEIVLDKKYTWVNKWMNIIVSDWSEILGVYKISYSRAWKKPNWSVWNYHLIAKSLE